MTVLEATLRAGRPARRRARSLVLGYPDVYAPADHVPTCCEHEPIGLEGIDDCLVDDMKREGHPRRRASRCCPTGDGWLLVEFGGETKDEADDKARDADGRRSQQAQSRPAMKLYDDPRRGAASGRCASRASARPRCVPGKPDTWEGWEDSAVPPERARRLPARAPQAARQVRLRRRALRPLRPGLHPHPHRLRPRHRRRASRQFRRSSTRRPTSSSRYGGSLSGEHGDGQSRAELLPKMFGDELVAGASASSRRSGTRTGR